MALERKTYTLTQLLSVHSTPVLLTKMAYVEHIFNVHASFEQASHPRLKTFRPTIPLIIRFTECSSFITYSIYPEGNFRGNQLLDCSISLSPLYQSQTIDLHVRIAS
ncbi:unnamed protein product, partial [Onchocerca ochengi]|uniref:Ovule protein n=1 Tax=Onchocerca ochengi TaxID=42157 RepID=A0A182EFH7_ONCOC